jgi:hypothetical protein
MKKEGFDKFSLEIFVMPSEFSSDYYFLFLEQYHLLNKRFNLNTQRIVNFRVNQGTDIYLYDIEGKILFYASKSLNQIRGKILFYASNYLNKNINLNKDKFVVRLLYYRYLLPMLDSTGIIKPKLLLT